MHDRMERFRLVPAGAVDEAQLAHHAVLALDLGNVEHIDVVAAGNA
jgi:hypothetical protein